MQTAEIMIYIVIAIVVAGTVAITTVTVDYEKNYHAYVKSFTTENEDLYKIPSTEFAQALSMKWEECRFGYDNMVTSLYVSDNSSIDRNSVVKELFRIDKCDVIDCRNQSGQFIMNGTIQTPKIINIRCFNNSLIVS